MSTETIEKERWMSEPEKGRRREHRWKGAADCGMAYNQQVSTTRTCADSSGVVFFDVHHSALTDFSMVSSYLDIAGWGPRARAAIRELLTLPCGWDSYGAEPIAERAARAAEQWINMLAAVSDLPEPMVLGVPDGRVGLSWDNGDTSVDVAIGDDGAGDYVAVSDTNSDMDTEGTVSSVAAFLPLLLALI